jgi:hypothetical protein
LPPRLRHSSFTVFEQTGYVEGAAEGIDAIASLVAMGEPIAESEAIDESEAIGVAMPLIESLGMAEASGIVWSVLEVAADWA